VLVDLTDGKRRCVVADFGQSEMKSEAYRLSGTPPPPRESASFSLLSPFPHHGPCEDGTLRWQAPELMSGHTNKLSVEVDVYAFAIVCVEILTKGALPWNMMDDGTVRHFVLS
jgi:abelson tyrosine-protein kinase 1